MNQDAVSPEHSSAAILDLPPPTTARVGGGTACYRDANGPSGAPVVVLLHGLPATSGHNRMHAFAPLSRHFRVITPDLCGHGGDAMEAALRMVRLHACLLRAPLALTRRLRAWNQRRREPGRLRAAAGEISGHDPRAIGGAARAITLLRSIDWLHEIDMPTTVLLTLRDNLFPPAEQRRMAAGRGKVDPSLGRGGRRRC